MLAFQLLIILYVGMTSVVFGVEEKDLLLEVGHRVMEESGVPKSSYYIPPTENFCSCSAGDAAAVLRTSCIFRF